jgi:hypothetical protein
MTVLQAGGHIPADNIIIAPQGLPLYKKLSQFFFFFVWAGRENFSFLWEFILTPL